MKIALLAAMGYLCLGLGAIGLLLPVWPTTPFVLAAVSCFSCTPRLQARIARLPFFREYVEAYRGRKGISKKTLLVSLAFLWGMLALSAFLAASPSMAVLLLMVGAAVTVHILWVAKPGERRGKKRGFRA